MPLSERQSVPIQQTLDPWSPSTVCWLVYFRGRKHSNFLHMRRRVHPTNILQSRSGSVAWCIRFWTCPDTLLMISVEIQYMEDGSETLCGLCRVVSLCHTLNSSASSEPCNLAFSRRKVLCASWFVDSLEVLLESSLASLCKDKWPPSSQLLSRWRETQHSRKHK